MKMELREKINMLKSFAWITADGEFIGDINNTVVQENPTVLPVHIAQLTHEYRYTGTGVWMDVDGYKFEYSDIKFRHMDIEDRAHCEIRCIGRGAMYLMPVGIRKSEKKIKLNELNDIINEYAVMATTSDGWKIVDMFAFESVPWDMTGFHTYAFKEQMIKKCIIGYDNDITYTLF